MSPAHGEPPVTAGDWAMMVALGVLAFAAILCWLQPEPEFVDDLSGPRMVCVPGHTGCPR